MRQNGFMLIELLVVIAIVALLAAMLFPVFARSREKARQTACLSNMRQMGLAVLMYADDYDETLPPTQHMGGRWMHDLLQPYTRATLFYRCPSDPSVNFERPLPGYPPDFVRKASYGINFWMTPKYGMYRNLDCNGYTTLACIRTPAETIYIAEMKENLLWDHFHPAMWPANPDNPCGLIDPTEELAMKWHNGGTNYTFLDGHARWLRFEQTWAPEVNRDWYDPRR
jgi:prepilin-type processing-associated H-X9-DG protein/prepilin-type N-terminal cleavage/methylation domain-containing protein